MRRVPARIEFYLDTNRCAEQRPRNASCCQIPEISKRARSHPRPRPARRNWAAGTIFEQGCCQSGGPSNRRNGMANRDVLAIGASAGGVQALQFLAKKFPQIG